MANILVIEDDPDIRELLQNFLENAGYQVNLAADGLEGLALFQPNRYDLLLLDIMMPKIDGYAVLELIRRESTVPVIFLTALDSEEDQLKGYDLAADDYIAKPFSMQVLLRKIAAVLRRSTAVGNNPGAMIHYRDLSLDLEAYQAYFQEQPLDLTQKEFELLRELLQHQGKVLSRQQLLDRVWDYAYYGEERVVDTHIKNLRKKMPEQYSETIRGVGYRIDKADEN